MTNRIYKTYKPLRKKKKLLCADKTRHHLIKDDQAKFSMEFLSLLAHKSLLKISLEEIILTVSQQLYNRMRKVTIIPSLKDTFFQTFKHDCIVL